MYQDSPLPSESSEKAIIYLLSENNTLSFYIEKKKTLLQIYAEA